MSADGDNANGPKAACRPGMQWIATSAICAVASIAGYHSGWNSTVARSDILIVEARDLDFGDVLQQRNFLWTIPIHNSTDREVKILDFRSSCSCASIEPRPLTIPPRMTRCARVILDLTSPSPAKVEDEDIASYPFNVTVFARLAPIDGELLQMLQWSVRGCVQKIISFSPRVVDFDDTLVLGENHPSRIVLATAHMPVERLETEFAQTGFAVHISRDAENQALFSLQVLPPPGIAAGFFTQTLHVTPILQNGTIGPRTSLPVVGRVTSDIQLLPSSLVFGRVSIGAKLTDTVMVRSKAGKPVVVTAAAIVDALPLEIDRISDSQFRFSFESAMAGSQYQDIEFRVYYPDDDVDQINILRISYFGVMHDAGHNGAQQE